MLTDENTTGFTQEELNEMNDEVRDEMGFTEIEDYASPGDYLDHLQWAEEKVLKFHGGA
jgi:hypothetical protein